jgi:porin
MDRSDTGAARYGRATVLLRPINLDWAQSLIYFLLLATLLVVAPRHAAAEGIQFAEDTFSGDWGGRRTRWLEQGVEVDVGSKVDILRNVAGGMSTGGKPMAHFEFGINADLDKALGWSGSSALLNVVYDGGGRLNADRVGSQMGVSNIEVPTSTYRLFQAWFQQEFFEGQGALLAGLYPIDSEFQVIESAAVLLQPQYGVTAELAETRGPSIFDNTAVGLRARLLSKDRAAYVLLAVMDGMPGDPDNPRGTHVKFDHGDGTMSIAEVGYKPAALAVAGKDPAERFEKYAAGAWRYSERVDDMEDVADGQTPAKRLSWGWYLLAERTLLKTQRRGIWAGFVRLSGTDGDSTAVRHAINVGLRGRGLLPGREDDVCAVGYSRATLSEKYRDTQQMAGVDTTAYEASWEITYRYLVNRWLAVQPDFQRIAHPGGDLSRSAAVIVGARVEVTF